MPSRVPGMKAGRSHRRPVCSVDPAHKVQRDPDGKWLCMDCFVGFANSVTQSKAEMAHKSVGGVELPGGVKDDRIEVPDVRPFMPNRAQRRRMRGN